MELNINDLLHDMVATRASDLHLKANSAPGMRIDGHIHIQDKFGILDGEQTRKLAWQMLNEEQRAYFEANGDLDCSYEIEGLARFRVNVLTQRGQVGMVIRQIPATVPNAMTLGLPKICLDLSMKPRGLVLVTGPTGSGKSTTLAAMIDHINENVPGHILTMEDPLEFVHPDKRCFVNQRNIGSDSRSFSEALRRALRQDPDIILIGEMRDLETISLAITAAETGHLVFGTLHTTSAISTVDRIIDVFPHDAQQQVRIQLSSTLQGVISQCLVPRIGGGRVAAHEILICTDGVRSLIREGKTAQMLNFLQTGKSHGMTTLEGRLIELVNQGIVAMDDAMAKANRPDEIARNAQVPGGSRAMADVGSSRPMSASPGSAQPRRTGIGMRDSSDQGTSGGMKRRFGRPS